MAFDRETLQAIHGATSGVCHRCGLALELARYGERGEYGQEGAPGAWEIDVTRPQPKSTVLLPACVACLRPGAARTMPRRERVAGDMSREAAPTTPLRIGYARPRVTPSDRR